MAGFQIVAKDKDGKVKGLHETFEAKKIVASTPSQAKTPPAKVEVKKSKK